MPVTLEMSSWFRTLLLGLQALQKPAQLLTVPKANESLEEHFAVRKTLCPDNEPWNVTQLLGFVSGSQTQTQTLHAPSIVADRVANAMASGDPDKSTRRQVLSERVQNLLTEIHAAIVERLHNGERHPLLVTPNDFNGKCIQFHGNQVGFDETVVLAKVADLDPTHPLHALHEEQWLYRANWSGREEPSYVLGLADGGGFGSPRPRMYYRVETCLWWTAGAEQGRLQRQREQSLTFQGALELMNRGVDLRERHGTAQIPLPDSVEPFAAVKLPVKWSERITLALDSGRHPERFLSYPKPSVSLDELLNARLVLGLQDHLKVDLKYAADRLAAICGGVARHGDLCEMLIPIVAAVDLRLRKAAERALEWSMVAAEAEQQGAK